MYRPKPDECDLTECMPNHKIKQEEEEEEEEEKEEEVKCNVTV
jgi:hypothetical protein